MGEATTIEWCDHTFSPWIGCAKVSAGCRNCYAEVDNPARIARGRGLELWGADAARKGKAESGWVEPLRWFRAAVKAGERRRVFCASQCDVFEDRRDLDAHRERLWWLIEQTAFGCSHNLGVGNLGYTGPRLTCTFCGRLCSGLDWLLLTKRPERILSLIPERWRAGLPPNVIVMTSVENQEAADERIPHLLRVPARVRGLSLEPLLGPVDLRGKWTRDVVVTPTSQHPTPTIDWLIIGGESDPQRRGIARPCDLAWIRDLRDQGRAAGAAVFCKQWGANPVDDGKQVAMSHPKGGDPSEWVGHWPREFPR